MYRFKAIDSEIKPYQLCLGNMLIDFIIANVNKTELKGYVDGFSVDSSVVDVNDILMSTKCVQWVSNVLMMSLVINDIAIFNIRVADYCCIINGISISEVINLLQNTDLTKKWNIMKHNLSLLFMKHG